MPNSLPYQEFLISQLKDPDYAALYLETHMELEEDEELDLRLIQLALSNVALALGEANNMTPEEIKHHQEKLNVILSQPGNLAVYHLGAWLNALGLKLTVAVTETSEFSPADKNSTPDLVLEQK